MKPVLFTATLLAVATSANAASVLTGGETWSALEKLDFESDANNRGLAGTTPMVNSGSDASAWNNNSASGKFISDGAGLAVTSGDAGSWARNTTSAPTYTSGKFRIEWTIDSYDFTNHGVASGGQDTLGFNVRSGNTDIAGLRIRIKDSGTDGIADQFQIQHRIPTADDKFSPNGAVDGSSATISSAAIEFDLDADTLVLFRNGVEIDSQTGFTVAGFDNIQLEAIGTWGTASTSLSTDSIVIYTAVPEPSSTALLGLGGLALILRRKK